MKLSHCKLCGTVPFYHKTNVSAVGCSFLGHVIECPHDENESMQTQTPPFVEHTLVVYGSSKEEAVSRWEEINGD